MVTNRLTLKTTFGFVHEDYRFSSGIAIVKEICLSYARLTQPVECISYKDEVGGSSPSLRTREVRESAALVLRTAVLAEKQHCNNI